MRGHIAISLHMLKTDYPASNESTKTRASESFTIGASEPTCGFNRCGFVGQPVDEIGMPTCTVKIFKFDGFDRVEAGAEATRHRNMRSRISDHKTLLKVVH